MSCINCRCKNCEAVRKRKRCKSCNRIFIPRHTSRALYCSDACRMKAYRNRRADKLGVEWKRNRSGPMVRDWKRYECLEEERKKSGESLAPESPLRGRVVKP